MNCDQAQNLFDAYLDGELSPGLETELHAHRLQCAACRQELALMEVAGHVIRSDVGEPKLDADFSNRLLACIEPAAPKPRRRSQWVIRIGGGLAAAACLTIAVTSLSKPEPQVKGEQIHGAPVIEGSTEPPTEPAGPELDEAAAKFQDSIEGVFQQIPQSSSNLKQLGQKTLLELFDELQQQELRDTDPDEAEPEAKPGDTPPAKDGDDVEDL